MSFLDRIRACAAFERSNYLPFRVGDDQAGLITPEFADHLASFPGVFDVEPGGVRLVASLTTLDKRTAAVESVLRELLRKGLISGWRDEPYRVMVYPEAPTLFLMERAAVPLFGVYGTGVHVNGYVGRGADMRMWIGKRSLHKPMAPGKLDQIVAGGRSASYSIRETLFKEGEEEAAIPAYLMARARAVSAITYCTERSEGLRRDVLYNFDLDLPTEFIPHNTDGEITEFYLWPITQVIEMVRETDEFKFNCALVVIDFLIRHGFIDHSEPDYLQLVRSLHTF
jgi:hypothetical protein